VFEDENGQFVKDDDGKPLYGVWLCDEEGEGPKSSDNKSGRAEK
jgi:hypothetical protein